MMNLLFLFLCLIYWSSCQNLGNNVAEKTCRCRINLHDIITIRNHPIFINVTTSKVLYPNDNMLFHVVIESGEEIALYCTHPDGFLIDEERHYVRKIIAKCLYRWTFSILDEEVDLRSIRCVRPIKPSTRYAARHCGMNGREIVMGFHLSDKKFVRQYKVCFNFKLLLTEFAFGVMHPLDMIDRNVRLLRVKKIDFFLLDKPISYYYRPSVFNKNIALQLGLFENSTKLNEEIRSLSLYPYFMLPPFNYIYNFEQLATMYYINVLPQITKIPWFYIRSALNHYAYQYRVKLIIYTGIIPQPIRLPHRNGTFVPIYLAYQEGMVPIPEVIWKVVYDKENLAGIAIIGINNVLKAGSYTPLCTDVSDKLPWINPHDKKLLYTCRIQDWFKVVRNAFPDYKVEKLLGSDFMYPSNKTLLKSEYQVLF